MRMEGLRKHPIPELFCSVEPNRDQSFPEVLAVHLDKGVEGLLLVLKFHKYAELPLEKIQQPVTDHPVKTAFLLYLLLYALLQLLHIQQSHQDQHLRIGCDAVGGERVFGCDLGGDEVVEGDGALLYNSRTVSGFSHDEGSAYALALLAQSFTHPIPKPLHHPQCHLLLLLHLISLLQLILLLRLLRHHLAALFGLSGPHFLFLLELLLLQRGQKRSVAVLGQLVRIGVVRVVLNLHRLLLLLSFLALDFGRDGGGDGYLLGGEHVVQFRVETGEGQFFLAHLLPRVCLGLLLFGGRSSGLGGWGSGLRDGTDEAIQLFLELSLVVVVLEFWNRWRSFRSVHIDLQITFINYKQQLQIQHTLY